jgi:hypothetical protein
MMTTLVYPGVGYDIATLFYNEGVNDYKLYVLIDSLPRHQHYAEDRPEYPHTKDIESFFTKLNEEFDSQCDVLIDAYPWTWEEGKYTYYYNTADFEAKLPNTKNMDLLIRGYRPTDTFVDTHYWKNIWLANDTLLPTRFRDKPNSYILDVIDNDDNSLIWTDESDSE